ncbi:hypothetical protein R3P38DRAFT_2765797 [Favolaschia claudopus]|uniref:Uncharacterized protein n=1 Tax=Favolaschia claudopus TaxID=2862362 RepID=A0AAW0D7M2_9AGAR
MPIGRPRLDPASKDENRRRSIEAYTEKLKPTLIQFLKKSKQTSGCGSYTNAEARSFSGLRASIAASDRQTQEEFRAQARENSARYRKRKMKEDREAEIEKRKARKSASEAIRKKPITPLLTKSRPNLHLSANPTTPWSSSRETHALHNGRETPVQTKGASQTQAAYLSRQEKSFKDLDIECDEDEDEFKAPNSFDERFPDYRKITANRPSRCSECGEEGCPGRGPGGAWGTFFIKTSLFICDHFLLPSPISTVDMASNNASLCLPTYFPDAGHEDKAVHSSSSDGVFIAVVARDWKGIVSSTETRDAKLRLHPGARAFAASTWAEISTLWAADCAQHHAHDSDVDGSSAIDISDIESSPPRPSSRLRSRSPVKAGSSHATVRFASPTKSVRGLSPTKNPSTSDVAVKFEEFLATKKPVLLFGVTGHNKIFRDGERALAALKAKPGAELIFTHEEEEIWQFVQAEAARMLKGKGSM